MVAEQRKPVLRENLLEKTKSIYKLVTLASRRGLEISDGSPKLVEAPPKRKPGLVALEEISEGKVVFKEKKPEKKSKL